jgi:hypothetical protein
MKHSCYQLLIYETFMLSITNAKTDVASTRFQKNHFDQPYAFYFYQILTALNMLKIMSEVAHDNWKGIK